VYIGGSGEMRNVKNFVGVDQGLQGCVRHLEINDLSYSFNPVSTGGDSIGGIDTGI